VGCRVAVSPRLIEDAQTSVRIRTALVNDPQLGIRGVEVDVTAGVAHLTGWVASVEEAQRLVSLVRTVPGVTAVRSDVQVGEPVAAASVPRQPHRTRTEELERPGDPRLLAVGGTVSTTVPAETNLSGGISAGPLVRLGSGTGLSPAIAFNWFAVDLFSGANQSERLARMSVKPVMGGAAYAWGNEHVSFDVSVVGGFSFNRLDTPDLVAGKVLALRADSGWVWRPGVNLWYDASTHIAFNVSAGYVVARPSVTFLQDGRIEKRDQRADTLLVSAGVAYKLF
jgi:hypothetical protein